jgi:hypothetical protein
VTLAISNSGDRSAPKLDVQVHSLSDSDVPQAYIGFRELPARYPTLNTSFDVPGTKAQSSAQGFLSRIRAPHAAQTHALIDLQSLQ